MKRLCARAICLALALLPIFALFGCGGGGGSSFVPPPPPPPPSPPPPLMITTPFVLPGAIQGHAYSTTLQATGGTPPYTWSGTSLFALAGISLAPSGTLSGTPTNLGSNGVGFTVTDSRGMTASGTFSFNVYGTLIFATQPMLPNLNVALSVGLDINLNGGVPPFTFNVTSGTLPPGLSFGGQNLPNLIQGIPTSPGTYSFTVQATDSFTPPEQISQLFTVNVLNNLVVPNATLPDAVQNLPYSEFIKAAGGTPPYQFNLVPNANVPPGLMLDSTTGWVFGTPNAPIAPFQGLVSVVISDSASPPASVNATMFITIQPPLAFQTTLGDSVRGLNYFGSLSVTGGRAPWTLNVTSGALPNGLTISGPVGGTFSINGNLTTDGLFSFTLQISDSYSPPNTLNQAYQIRISEPMMISGSNQSQILYNQQVSATFPATGGFPPYTWSVRTIFPAVTLPPGFAFDLASGTLSGMPIGNGSSDTIIDISAQDSSNPPIRADFCCFNLSVIGQLVVNTTSLPSVAVGSKLILEPQIIGGAIPFTPSLISGSLPPGITFGTSWDGNIILTGSPMTAGSYTFTMNISDSQSGSLHQIAPQQLTLTVKDPGQMTRNDTIAQATPLSNITLLASISPFSDPGSTAPDVDVYSMSAAPGSIVQVGADANNGFIQPPRPNSLLPVVEVFDANGNRYQTCSPPTQNPPSTFTQPCNTGLNVNTIGTGAFFGFQVPGAGTAPVTFYVRVSDFRGDARPDFVYTFSVTGVN